MNEELKPCPFCNSKKVFSSINQDEEEYFVECKDCGAQGPIYSNTNYKLETTLHELARKAWNDRK